MIVPELLSSPSLWLNWQWSKVYVQSSCQAKYIRIKIYFIKPVNGEMFVSQQPEDSNITIKHKDNDKKNKEYDKSKVIEMDSYTHNMHKYKQCGSELLTDNK